MAFNIIRQDITNLKVDAIVNAANVDLQRGGGVCGAIFSKAGIDELQQACDLLSPINTGEAVITSAFNLPSKFIIHTAGPIYNEKQEKLCEKQLKDCYINSLNLSKQNKCKSIAFPLISSGIYGYPKDKALKIATNCIKEFLHKNDMEILLVVFDEDSFQISEKLFQKVDAYVDKNYVQKYVHARRLSDTTCCLEEPEYLILGATPALDDLEISFSNLLFEFIDSKGLNDVEVYKRANIDRKLFSKIRKDNGYMPKKKTAIALAIALELNLTETNDLLDTAGYTLSKSQFFDVIIRFFIEKKKYDIFEINEVLFKYNQPLLGSV